MCETIRIERTETNDDLVVPSMYERKHEVHPLKYITVPADEVSDEGDLTMPRHPRNAFPWDQS